MLERRDILRCLSSARASLKSEEARLRRRLRSSELAASVDPSAVEELALSVALVHAWPATAGRIQESVDEVSRALVRVDILCRVLDEEPRSVSAGVRARLERETASLERAYAGLRAHWCDAGSK